ncbi:MAG: hypothetical protein E6J02_00210 [Chloroflexi bacterium]|nr:MAG: hypothetical protein E6J02_00210 [Chloroflexota bacterium]
MSDHPDLENSVVAYLVGAAEPDEAELMRVHLAGCEDCRRLVARLQQVVDALPLAVAELEPSKDLKSRIMAAATASSQTHAGLGPAGDHSFDIRIPRWQCWR